MAELFDFGIDFGLSYFEPIPEKKSVTQQEYQKGKIDYYDQTLGALGGDFKIPTRTDDDDDRDRKDVNINVVGDRDDSGESSSLPSLELTNPSANLYDVDIKTYGDALSEKGFGDKTPFNVFGTDIYLGGVPKTKEEAKKGLERLVSKESAIRQTAKLAGRFAGVDPIVTNTALAFATGRTVNDPFGNPSFRPSNFVLGGIHDVNMSIQYDNVAQMKAALGTTGPKGFATYINGQLVTRPPKGFNYTGTYDVPREMMQRIDAIDKGIVPSSFDYRTETGDRGITVNLKEGKGLYDERGRYHDRNGSYVFGSRKASDSLGKQVGLTTSKVEEILGRVRSNKDTTLSEEIRKAQQEQVEQRIQDTNTTVTDIPDSYGVKDDIYSDFGTVSVDTSTDDGGNYDPGTDSTDMGFSTRYGGQIGQGMQAGGPAGFIGGPPENYSDQTTIADDIPLEVPEGAFVINAPAVEYAGSEDISKMLTEAYQKAGQGVDKSGRTTTIPSKEQVDIMISRGEVVVPPNIAKIIGYDRLEKINNRGKREVTRRQKQGDQEKPQARQANSGGFINKAKGDKITVYRGEPPKNKIPLGAKLIQDKYTGSWFAPNKDFTRTYGVVAKSMKVSFDEYKKGAKKAFLKKNIARYKMENEKSQVPRNLTRKQRSQIFQSLKYIDEIADNVKQGKRSTKAFIDFLYEGVFPKEKDRATVMLLETAKRSPKAFGKLVVDSLVKNVVSKGVPVLGTISSFAPTEMGDATLDNSGFIQYERVQ